MKRFFVIFLIVLFLPLTSQAANISEARAKQIAQQKLNELLPDNTPYQYVLAESVLLNRNNRTFWVISYFGGTTDDIYDTNCYDFCIDASTGVIFETHIPTLRHPVEKTFSDLVDQYGAFFKWSLEQKATYSAMLRNSLKEFNDSLHTANYANCPQYVQYLISMDFRVPSDQHLSQEIAQKLAAKALQETEAITYVQLQKYDVFSSFMLNGDNVYVWKFMYVSNDYTVINNDCGYQVQLDAYSGDILSIRHRFSGEDDPFAGLRE